MGIAFTEKPLNWRYEQYIWLQTAHVKDPWPFKELKKKKYRFLVVTLLVYFKNTWSNFRKRTKTEPYYSLFPSFINVSAQSTTTKKPNKNSKKTLSCQILTRKSKSISDRRYCQGKPSHMSKIKEK